MSQVIEPRHLHDYGKLLLAFVMVWAYFSFSQFLIIWSGNLAEETTFFLNRIHGGWQVRRHRGGPVPFHAPFLLLLSRDLKRNVATPGADRGVVFAMRWLDFYWQAASLGGAAPARPGRPPPRPRLTSRRFTWLDLVAPIAIGGIWLWFFIGQLARAPVAADRATPTCGRPWTMTERHSTPDGRSAHPARPGARRSTTPIDTRAVVARASS